MDVTKVPVLKISFIEEILAIWQDEFIDKDISEFIDFIDEKYGATWQQHCAPGDTGIYLDNEIKYKIITQKRNGKEKAIFDKEFSYLMFEGLFALDADDNKVPLNEVQASDIRMWNCLSLFILKDYIVERWGDSSDEGRFLMKSSTNGKISRNGISRLYWSAKLSYDASRSEKLELLEVLWKTQDFYTQVSERSICGMRETMRVFLDFCNKEENTAKVFKSKSTEGYIAFRKLLKLFTSDNNVLAMSLMDKDALVSLFEENLEACK
ncbi:MAG: DUF6339 family protein [Flavobacteriaceae bacterium]|nr:DUF6339 family protein [Flavobacteriaceae bacterium]